LLEVEVEILMKLPRTAIAAVLTLAFALAGCATIGNVPINQPTSNADAGVVLDPKAEVGMQGRAAEVTKGDLLINLAFSGGGTRAAAFSFGVLQGLDRARANVRGREIDLLDQVGFVSGVSGGSVTAAYFGLKKHAALADFRDRFLIKDAEEDLITRVGPVTLVQGLGGGVNDATRLRSWLDTNLFEGATFSNLYANRRPTVLLNATDLYNGTPFVFIPVEFSAICSDLAQYPISAAVAASAAVPIAFSPVVLETYPNRCKAKLPDWLLRAGNNPNASPLLRAFARGIERASDGTMKYIKLVDGGLVDNYGLSGITIVRESAQTPYGPLTPGEAIRLRRVLFLTVDAGNESKKDWGQKLEGPSGAQLISAIADVSVAAASRSSYSAFEESMRSWNEKLIRWRCGLAKAEVKKYLGARAWNCRDLKFFIGRVSFDDLDKERAEKLALVPTRFKLPSDTVDDLIGGGIEALSRNPVYRNFIGSL
jgi:NTE family protein